MDHLKPSSNGTPPLISKEEIDAYLKQRQPLSWVQDLQKRLRVSPEAAAASGCHYDIPTMNALVLYVGVSAISQVCPGQRNKFRQTALRDSPPGLDATGPLPAQFTSHHCCCSSLSVVGHADQCYSWG